MISIQQMQYILALSEELQFQRASEKCFITQPTLSMQIKKAEETLGGVLFDRSRNPLELTAYGKEMLPVFRDTLNEYEKISEVFDKSRGIYKEQIRMAIIPTIAGYMLPDLYARWKKDLDHVQLIIEEMKTEDLLIALEQRKIDVGILAGPVVDPKLRSTLLYREEIKAYFPSESKKEVTATELQDSHPWLLTPGNCLRTQMMHFCELKNENKENDWDYEGGNIDLLKRMVEKQGGYTLVPVNYIKKANKDYKSITSVLGEFPAREIIALTPNRSTKWENIERLVRNVQLFYGKNDKSEKFQVLSWK